MPLSIEVQFISKEHIKSYVLRKHHLTLQYLISLTVDATMAP